MLRQRHYSPKKQTEVEFRNPGEEDDGVEEVEQGMRSIAQGGQDLGLDERNLSFFGGDSSRLVDKVLKKR